MKVHTIHKKNFHFKIYHYKSHVWCMIVTVMMGFTAAVWLFSCLAVDCIAPRNNFQDKLIAPEKNFQDKVNTTIIERNLPLQRTGTNNSSVCPPWTLSDATTRKHQCGRIPGDPLICEVMYKTYILDCYCVTTVGNKTEIGQCNYNCARQSRTNQVDTVYLELPSNRSSWNDFMCKEFGRSGTLCGQCDKERNYYPRAYSFDLSCTQCDGSMSSNLWKYIALAYLPLTVFYLLVFLHKLDINSSQLQGFIIFSQFISTPALARNLLLTAKDMPILLELARLLLTVYGVWNLDFFRSYDNNICFRTSSLNISLLDLGVAVYPLILMLVTYLLVQLYDINYKPVVLLWKPFKICFDKWYKEFSLKTSLVNSIATFLFLAYSKFFNICFDILTPVKVYQFITPNQTNTSLRLYYDSTVVYFSSEHVWYALTALIIMSIFVIIPVLLVLLYPLSIYQKFLSLFPLRWQLSLHAFFDSFQGCYKDGTEPGTRDCRWFGPMLYSIRIIFLVVYTFTLDAVFFPFGSICLTIFAIVTIYIDPFKPHLQHMATSMMVFILFIDMAYVSAIGSVLAKGSNTISSYVFTALAAFVCFLPIFYVAYIILYWIIYHCKCRKYLCS